ncbi:acyltransferase [uncultured Desulfosarcina sp.]|uniref:acyltransferase n=1 Tax=uncultured Desulfosarcina sp. TaxID=218289 RepID=UPI0029C82478|nr:acyltransferase [uncultured Desulfosarcina sp.]
MKDEWGIWANRLFRKRGMVAERFWTFHSKLLCWYWDIKIGKNCKFWGKTHFNRAPHSTIHVGAHCRFRSAFWSNLVGINRPCMLSTLRPNAKIMIGDHSGFSGTVISAAESISIGKNVLCGANVTITDTNWHHIVQSICQDTPVLTDAVTICDNVWLAMNVIVLKGVRIGPNSVVAANSVVTRDIPENVLAAGQPAKIIKQISTGCKETDQYKSNLF